MRRLICLCLAPLRPVARPVHPLREARQVSKALRTLVVMWMVFGLFVVVPKLMAGDDPPPPQVVEVDVTVQGKTADEWHQVAAHYLSRDRNLAAAIRFDPEVSTAINLACTVYGHCDELWRKARCESHLYRYAKNRHSTAAGLLQFLDTTWASTPYRRFSPYDPYANALAAGWMHAHKRGGEWVCQ